MPRHLLLAAAIFLSSLLSGNQSFAQYWVPTVETNLLLTQGQYSRNWAGSETGSVAWTFNTLATLNKDYRSGWQRRHTLKLAFGQTHAQNSAREWQTPQKSTDLIDFEALVRKSIGLPLDPFVAGRIETSFLDQRDSTKTRSFNPLRFTESAGFSRIWRKVEKSEFSSRFGLAAHQTLDDYYLIDAANGLHGNKTIYDAGLELVTDYTTPFATEQATYTTKLLVFQALLNSSDKDFIGLPNEDYWRAPDVAWEHIFGAKIGTYLTVNLYAQLLYDKEIALGGRFKQTLSLGLTYKLV